MEAIRIVEHPRDGKIVINLPRKLKTQKSLEIIIFPYEETVKKKQEKTFDPRKFRGAANLDMTNDEIDQECRKLREEWDRNF